jgi:hypothetical protein
MPSKHKHPMIRLHSDVADRLPVCNGAIASEALRRYYRILDESAIDFSEDEYKLLKHLAIANDIKKISVDLWANFFFAQFTEATKSATYGSIFYCLLEQIHDYFLLKHKIHSMSLVQAIALVERIERG